MTDLTAPYPGPSSRPPPPARPSRAARLAGRLVVGFFLLQFACQVALMVEGLGQVRVFFRAATFASSIAMLAVMPAVAGRRLPGGRAAATALVVTALGVLHPTANTLAAGLAQVAMYLAIWGPLFWAGRAPVDVRVLDRVLLLFWGFSVAGAGVGVLQVYDPVRFSPYPEFVRQLLGTNADGLMITLADGRQVWRPMGLSDSPGGAAVAGSFAALLGLALATTARSLTPRAAALVGAAAGMFCVYICQVRSVLVITAVAMLVYTGLMFARGRLARVGWLSLAVPAVVGGGFAWSAAVGGAQTVDRFNTLTEDAPAGVYYKNRGIFLEDTLLEQLPRYPFGAGLGRWGMMFGYFGDPSIPSSPSLWAEIQATAWVYDGGLLLLLVGYGAVLAACGAGVRLALRAPDPRVADAAAVVSAVNLSWVAATFNYPVFISQTGMMFWVLNGLLVAAAAAHSRRPPVAAGRRA